MPDSKDTYTWVKLPCCCCDSISYKTLGYRGGSAHRIKAGVKSLIVRCSLCDHIYPSPMPIARDINTLYSDHEQYFIHHNLNKKIYANDSLLERIEKNFGYKGRLLDIGSGRGEMLYAAKKRGWDSYGVEASKEFADLSRNMYGAKVSNCSLEESKFPDNYFDVVILNAVIEHLYYPKKVLLEINRISKPCSLLYINTSNELSLYHIIGNLYFKIRGNDWVTQLSLTFSPYHVQGFTKNSIRTMLARTGFFIEELNTYSGRALLPHKGFKEFGEYIGVVAIRNANKFLKMGRVMEVVAKKLKQTSSLSSKKESVG